MFFISIANIFLVYIFLVILYFVPYIFVTFANNGNIFRQIGGKFSHISKN